MPTPSFLFNGLYDGFLILLKEVPLYTKKENLSILNQGGMKKVKQDSGLRQSLAGE